MRFILENGLPYLVNDGKAYPVKITNGNDVQIDEAAGAITDSLGGYSLTEVVAKCGPDISSIKPKTTKNKEAK